jgi:GMP synthase (glutamine-hydrolysing)
MRNDNGTTQNTSPKHRRSPQVAILDFGSQYSHLIARRVRELHVYCELYSCLVTPEELGKHELTAVILSGGPSSVYEEGAPHVAQGVWDIIKERNVPLLGICYGMQVSNNCDVSSFIQKCMYLT